MASPIGGNINTQAAMGLTGANIGTAQGMAYQPMVGQVGQANMGQYMNPYTNQVIGGLAQDTGRMMQTGANQLGSQASSAGAFGGSRHGIAQGQMMSDAMRNFGQQAGTLRQQGFQNAQNLAGQDIDRAMQADQFGAQQRMNAANQMAGLSQQGFNMGMDISNQQFQQGQAQQAMNQALIDAAKAQYGGYTGAPSTALGFMGQALGSTPNVSSTTQSRQPGLFDYLTMGATNAAGLAKLSDERLKCDVSKVGKLDNGLDVVTWKWTDMAKKSGLPLGETKGLIAQQVAKIVPDAIKRHASGYLMVDYGHPELRGAI
jgi:hypothetical protein